MKLYHPDLDVTIERTERQAAVLADAGWEPADRPPPPPDPEPQDDTE